MESNVGVTQSSYVIPPLRTQRPAVEIPKALEQKYEVLSTELKQPELSSENIACVLVEIEEVIKKLKKLDWSYLVDELIQSLKVTCTVNCIYCNLQHTSNSI
jgi:hypothetical protein